MIEFRGKVSAENYKAIYKKYKGGVRYAMIISWCVFCIPLIVIGIHMHNREMWIWFGVFTGLFTLIAGFFILFPGIAIREKEMIKNLPVRVTIDEDTIRRYGENDFYASEDLTDLKKVLDMGNWYQFKFYFPHKDIAFICQKDLIVEGTIEEFEELFKDYIVRRIKEK